MVVNSKTIKTKALCINASTKKLRQTIAGMWDLDMTSGEVLKAGVPPSAQEPGRGECGWRR